MLGSRILIGALLGAGAALIIVEGGWVYFAVLALLALLAMGEFFRMARPYRPLALAGYVTLGAMLYFAWLRTPAGVLGCTALVVLLAFLSAALGGPKPGVTGRMAITVLGTLYVGLGFAHLLMLRRLGEGMPLVLAVVFGTWAGDTFAYFVGHYFGSTPMAPRLSPKKTWEGFAGGVLGTVLATVFVGLFTSITPSQSLLIGLTIAVVGPLGDLFESLIKRDVDVKDAGRLLAGHGGVLDRFDALLFAAVAVYYLAAGAMGF